jgi:hypothetical protein
MLCYHMFQPYKAIFRQDFFIYSNSQYANHIVYLRYIVDVSS